MKIIYSKITVLDLDTKALTINLIDLWNNVEQMSLLMNQNKNTLN